MFAQSAIRAITRCRKSLHLSSGPATRWRIFSPSGILATPAPTLMCTGTSTNYFRKANVFCNRSRWTVPVAITRIPTPAQTSGFIRPNASVAMRAWCTSLRKKQKTFSSCRTIALTATCRPSHRKPLRSRLQAVRKNQLTCCGHIRLLFISSLRPKNGRALPWRLIADAG